MPLCISNSRRAAAFHIRMLVGISIVLVLGFEISSDYLLRHHSETYDRVSQQYAEAVKVRPARPGEPLPVLMVGNSLLLDGIDTKRLQELTSPLMRIYPIFLEATGYYDWFYGLQRLFRQGSRPQVVVLGVGVNGFLANSVRQDYVPRLLFDLEDSLGAASDLAMDRTATSNLVLAHASVFWDTRSVIRTQILRHTIPRYSALVSLLKPQPATPPAADLERLANERVQRLREICEAHRARLILLVPPTPSSAEADRLMTLAARRLGVETLVPLDPSSLSERYYQTDELHLNSEGAALFTSAVATALPKTVAQESTLSP
jgi:lysophospholipase L1-like esterase